MSRHTEYSILEVTVLTRHISDWGPRIMQLIDGLSARSRCIAHVQARMSELERKEEGRIGPKGGAD